MDHVELEWIKSLARSNRMDYIDAYRGKDNKKAAELIHLSTLKEGNYIRKKFELYVKFHNSYQPKESGNIRIFDFDSDSDSYPNFMLFRSISKLVCKTNTGIISLYLEKIKEKMKVQPILIHKMIASLGPFNEVVWLDNERHRTSAEIAIKIAFNSLIKNSRNPNRKNIPVYNG